MGASVIPNSNWFGNETMCAHVYTDRRGKGKLMCRCSCADAILPHLIQFVNMVFVNDGDKVYMCLYDLHKAYDSVEYSI